MHAVPSDLVCVKVRYTQFAQNGKPLHAVVNAERTNGERLEFELRENIAATIQEWRAACYRRPPS